jgi:hypothetical protein
VNNIHKGKFSASVFFCFKLFNFIKANTPFLRKYVNIHVKKELKITFTIFPMSVSHMPQNSSKEMYIWYFLGKRTRSINCSVIIPCRVLCFWQFGDIQINFKNNFPYENLCLYSNCPFLLPFSLSSWNKYNHCSTIAQK